MMPKIPKNIELKMKSTILAKTISFLFIVVALSFTAMAQNQFAVNQKVEGKGKCYKATVLEVKENSYKIHYDNYDSSWDEAVSALRIRSSNSETKTQGNSKSAGKSLVYGKYGCTTSRYVRGEYEYLAKGSFVISKNGKYAYYGFEKPSEGTFTLEASGKISFKGGYFDKGEATPIEGRENRFYLVFPTIPDGR